MHFFNITSCYLTPKFLFIFVIQEKDIQCKTFYQHWFALLFLWQLECTPPYCRKQRKGNLLISTSFQFSRLVVSDSLRPHESQHARHPCPSPTPKFTQIHAHRVGDAIQPSHPLSSPSPPAPNPSQHQGLFQWVSSSHEVAKVLTFQLQHQSFQWKLERCN